MENYLKVCKLGFQGGLANNPVNTESGKTWNALYHKLRSELL